MVRVKKLASQIRQQEKNVDQLFAQDALDWERHMAIEHEFRDLRRMLFSTMFLVVCLVLDRLRILFFYQSICF